MRRPTADDVFYFLKTVGYNVNLSDAQSMIKVYDADRDGSLHTTEFHQLLVSNTDKTLRENFSVRPHTVVIGDPSTIGRGGET